MLSQSIMLTADDKALQTCTFWGQIIHPDFTPWLISVKFCVTGFLGRDYEIWIQVPKPTDTHRLCDIATAVVNWNIPDCGNLTMQQSTYTCMRLTQPWTNEMQGIRGRGALSRTRLTVVSANVLGFGGQQEGPQGFSTVLGAWPSDWVLRHLVIIY